jgi:hypothetical protein
VGFVKRPWSTANKPGRIIGVTTNTPICRIWFHLGIGVIGVAAGVVAGGSAIADKRATFVAVAAFISALVVGLQTFLNPGKSADDNWRRAAGLATVSRKWNAMAIAPEEPTKEEFNKLLAEWQELETP